LVLQALNAVLGESSSPLPHDLAAHLKTTGDHHVAQAIGRVQHDLRPLHIAVGQRKLRGARLKLATLLGSESDVDRVAHPHRDSTPSL
jgi:hypothetical protein